MKYPKGIAVIIMLWGSLVYADIVYDKSRNRDIPVSISYPTSTEKCSKTSKCSVVFLSAGYGIPHTKYAFLSNQLNELGYLVFAVRHELPNDPPLSVTGNLYKTRSENWSRGAKTLALLRMHFIPRYKNYDFDKLVLVGHSNGGDISSWLGNENMTYISKIITLDHRRVPLPKTNKMQVFSIRASDYPADNGVLPSDAEQIKYGSCIIQIPKAKHNDISDDGPLWLKMKIKDLIRDYLAGKSCNGLQEA
ncbi:MAG: alpha/beta hydrolase [Kangiellaceae bacterium]|nr:alpha/beta hydrolase [Kangiellaceae bacterium]